MANYYQPEIETASREQILAWQNERLVKQVQHVWDNVPYYRAKMEEKGLTPADIQSVDDLKKLPFLTPEEVEEIMKEKGNTDMQRFGYQGTQNPPQGDDGGDDE